MTAHPSSPSLSAQRDRLLIPRLAFADLRHEWVLTSCMVLAIAAVVAPLLLLLGLKHGTIESYRTKLVQDPVYREIRPVRSQEYAAAWFDSIRTRPDVAYVVPNILRGASSVIVIPKGRSAGELIDILPTTSGDPLLLENNARVPLEGQCVLSYAAAEKLKVRVGDFVDLQIERRQGERQKIETQVIAVLDPRADVVARVYAPFALAEDVETYRDGHAVPQRGWPGSIPRPYVSFDGINILVPTPLSAADQVRLSVNTGFAGNLPATAETFDKRYGFAPPVGETGYELTVASSSVQIANINAIRDQLRGQDAMILPYVEHVGAIVDPPASTGKGSAPVTLVGLSVSPEQAQRLGMAELPWASFARRSASTPFDEIAQILLPTSFDIGDADRVTLRYDVGNGLIAIPLKVAGRVAMDRAVVPIDLIGILRTAKDRRVVYDAERGGLVLSKSGNRGFRLYARTIDDVAGLYRHFLDQNIDVVTQIGEIQKVKLMDRGLTQLFWLVAAVGIVGGIAALIASLYAAVERKRRDFGMMRLMGVPKTDLFGFPVFQAIFVAVFSVLCAFGGFGILSMLINRTFAGDLPIGENLCYLPPAHFATSFALTTITAMLSSLLAAVRATGIDPAEAIREE